MRAGKERIIGDHRNHIVKSYFLCLKAFHAVLRHREQYAWADLVDR